MQFYHSQICQWFWNTPYRALDKAYQASKRVRNIQKDYLSYKNSIGSASRRSWYNVAIYIDNVLNQSASTIYWALLEFKITNYLWNIIKNIFHRKNPNVQNFIMPIPNISLSDKTYNDNLYMILKLM